MPLSSQTARSASRRSHMYRRSRRRNPRVAFGIGLVLIAGVVATAMAIRGGPGESAANQDQNRDGSSMRDGSGSPMASNAGALTEDRAQRSPSGSQRSPVDLEPNAATMPSTPIDMRKPGERGDGDTTASDRPTSTADGSDTGPTRAEAPAQDETSDRAPSSSSPRRSAAASRDDDSPSRRVSSDARQRATQRMETGMTLLSTNRLIEARQMLTAAIDANALAPADAQRVRDTLGELNDTLVFSRDIVPDDPFARRYTVQSGDTLERIVRREHLHVDWRFIQRINGIRDPRTIRVGQTIKLITGPFHAIVDKDAFRLDLYLGESSQRVFVATSPVGLGENDSTPEGRFVIRPKGKVIDPPWTNPRTNEYYEGGDPENPIGDRWLALDGLDPEIRDLTGYGLHGTIEPESIGRMESMGCIRLLPDDIHLIYEVLADGVSEVHVVRNRHLMASVLP